MSSKKLLGRLKISWKHVKRKVLNSIKVKKIKQLTIPSHYKFELKQLNVKKNIIKFTWKSDGKIPGILKNEWSVVYPHYIDLEVIPRELLWMIFALVSSELLAQASKVTIILPERLDQDFIEWWSGILKINHKANPYGGNISPEADFKLVNGEKTIPMKKVMELNNFEIACMNGMGKDSLAQIGMLQELIEKKILSITVDNSYLFGKRDMFQKLIWFTKRLESRKVCSIIIPYVQPSFQFKIIPWYIFSLPLLFLHGVSACYSAGELNFNKCVNGIPLKPNATIMVLESVNRLLRSLGYRIIYRCGPLPLSTFGTMKLLLERYPNLQTFQYSCMYNYPPCSRCIKCQSQMAYISLCKRDYEEYGYRGPIKYPPKNNILDLEREPIEHAMNKLFGIHDELDWTEKYYKDALPYSIPGIEKILKQHFDSFSGPFTSLKIYEYDVNRWRQIIDTIY